jgi:4-alpha-glucanotransferase
MEVPGFKIPQWERSQTDHGMIPGKDYARLSLATFATHDHPPIRKFWEDWVASSQSEDAYTRDTAVREMREMMDFCGAKDISVPQPFTPEIHAAMLRGLYETNSWLAVHMITDLFGTDDRFNVPGAIGNLNWTTRISKPISEWDKTWSQPLAASQKALEATGRTVFSQSGLPDDSVSA